MVVRPKLALIIADELALKVIGGKRKRSVFLLWSEQVKYESIIYGMT